MKFFTSNEDLGNWVIGKGSPDEAARTLMTIAGSEYEQDIVDTCRSIFENKDDPVSAQNTLFEILKGTGLTQTAREANMKNDKMKKEAQVVRNPGLYNSMPLRVCPKLPYSVGKSMVSTYNCRHHCIDSITVDEDPLRVYCAEALWRRHVMDKFSRDTKDKDGKLVGGYINSRFQVFHDDGGNQMELANGERTREPRPSSYSTERRLSEGRGDTTTFLTPSAKKSNGKVVKLAAKKEKTDDAVFDMFNDIMDMKEAGVTDEDILYKVAEHYEEPITVVASVYKMAMKKMQAHGGILYAYSNPGNMQKTAAGEGRTQQMEVVRDIPVIAVEVNGGRQPRNLLANTPISMETGADGTVFKISGGPDAGQIFELDNVQDMAFFNPVDGGEAEGGKAEIPPVTEDTQTQEEIDAEELGLNEGADTQVGSEQAETAVEGTVANALA